MATGDDTASDPFPRPSQTRREGIPHVPGTPKSSPCRDRKRTHHRQRTRPDTHRPCSGNQAVNKGGSRSLADRGAARADGGSSGPPGPPYEEEASNHSPVPWLKTVVLNGVRKGVT